MDALETKGMGTFSRRSFVKLAVGTLAVLPTVASELLIEGGQGTAYAVGDEASGTHRLVVVSPTQVGLYIADQASDANTPVPGAKVVLTSRYNGKALSATSDEGGIVLFDVEELSEPEREYGRCVFNGTIDIAADGYREFHMSLARIQGGLALSVPTRSLEPGLPYPSRVSFAEWDMLYMKNEFVSASGNTDSHEILVEIRNLSKPCTVALRDRDSEKVYASANLTPTAGIATASMPKPYLQKDTSDALPVDGSFCMQLDDGETVYEFPVALGVRAGVADTFSIAPEKSYAPANNRVPSSGQLVVPDYIPGIGGQSLTPTIPIGNVVFVVDPFGYLYIAWSTPRVGYINDDSTPNAGKWGRHPYTSASQQFNSFFDKNMDKALSMRDKIAQGSNITQLGFTPKIEATMSLRFLAMAQWNYKTGSFSGNAQFQALGHFGAGFCEQFAVGPVPFFIDFMLNADAVLELAGLGFATPDGLDATKYDWDYTNTGTSCTLNLSLTLSVGVGISGFLSVGVRGTFLLSLFSGYTAKPDSLCKLPHEIVGYRINIAVEVHLLFFKWSGNIKDYYDPQWWDSWRDRDCKDSSHLFVYNNSEENEAPDFDDFRLADGSYCYEAPYGQPLTSRKSMWEIMLTEAVPVTQSQLRLSSDGSIANLESAEELLYDYDASSSVKPDAGEDFIEYLRYDRDDRFTFAPGGAGGAMFTAKEGKVVAPPASQDEAGEGNALGVSKVDQQLGGIWPKSDYQLLKDIYADPHVKVVFAEDKLGATRPYIFRIGISEIGGEQRPILMYHRITDGTILPATVVGFSTGIEGVNRYNLYDYDFDIIFENQENNSRYCILLMSNTEDTSQLDGMPDTYDNIIFTYLTCDVDVARWWDDLNWNAFSFKALNESAASGGRNMFFCPKITLLRSARDYDLAMFSWLHRYTDSPDIPLDSPDAKLSIGLGMSDRFGVSLPKFETALGPLADNSGYDLCATRGDDVPDTRDFYLYFAVRGEEKTTCAYAIAEVPFDTSPMRVREATQMSVEEHDGMLVPWTGKAGHTGYLTSYDGKLAQAVFNREAGRLEFTQLADFDFNAKSFCTDSEGEFIYWSVGRNGVGEVEYDAQGNAKPVQVTDNRIMATKLYKGTFCDPYVLSNMSHPVDQMCTFAHGYSTMALLTTTIDDFANSLASLWYTEVPVCVCPTMLASTLVTPLVPAGESAEFLVTIRNDGNVHITGATLALIGDDGQEVSTASLEFSKDTMQASVYNPPAETATGKVMTIGPRYAGGYSLGKPRPAEAEEASQEEKLQPLTLFSVEKAYADEIDGLLNVDATYELAPGKTAVYSAKLPVPSDWSGSYQVSLKIKNVNYVGTANLEQHLLLGNAGSSPLISSFAEELSSLQVSNEIGANLDAHQDAPVAVRRKDSDENGGLDPENSTDSSGGNSSQSSTNSSQRQNAVGSSGVSGSDAKKLAATGDDLHFGPLGIAVGAAAAGLAAYSARRQALEDNDPDSP
ncbi:MAG: hypothetical protein IJ131_08095 [Eggerthellaceae bacterium]|nr:hypothetical protein [Eggerthellaceae bacterium]